MFYYEPWLLPYYLAFLMLLVPVVLSLAIVRCLQSFLYWYFLARQLQKRIPAVPLSPIDLDRL